MTSPLFRILRFTAAASLLLLGALPVSAQTKLEWKLTPGQVLNQVISQETTSSANVGGQAIDTKMTQVLDFVWKVGNVDSSRIASVDAEITRIRVTLASIGINLDFDSDSETSPEGMAAMLTPAFKAMVHAKFSLKIDPQGKIVESSVAQETLDRLKTIPNLGPVGEMLNEETLVSMIRQGTATLPPNPVVTGDSWTDSIETKLPKIGTMTSHSTLVYEGPEEVEGKVLQRISMQVKSAVVPSAGGLFKITVKDQTSSGVLYFDAAAGRLSHSKLQQQMTMAMEVAGQSFDQKTNQNINAAIHPAE